MMRAPFSSPSTRDSARDTVLPGCAHVDLTGGSVGGAGKSIVINIILYCRRQGRLSVP